VGDSVVDDVEGARAAGIRAVLLDRAGRVCAAAGITRSAPGEATASISSLSQLPKLVDELSRHLT
jgi:FMN phosphatase YigB (HAD superfamily)